MTASEDLGIRGTELLVRREQRGVIHDALDAITAEIREARGWLTYDQSRVQRLTDTVLARLCVIENCTHRPLGGGP